MQRMMARQALLIASLAASPHAERPMPAWMRQPPARFAAAGARLHPPRIPEQDRARARRRRRRAAAARADACVLRVLRLAFVGARPLAARAPCARVSRAPSSRAPRARRLRSASPQAKVAQRGRLSAGRRARLRSSAPMAWPGCCSSRRNCASWEDADAQRWARDPAAARSRSGGPDPHLAAEASLSDPRRRALADGIRFRPHPRLVDRRGRCGDARR